MSEDENNSMSELDPAIIELLEPDGQEEAIAIARGIAPWSEGMTDDAVMICIAFVELKGDVKAVSAVLGYSPARSLRTIRSRLSQRLIGELARLDLQGTGIMIAIQTLKAVATADSASPAARVRAAEGLANLSNLEDERTGRKSGGGGKDLNTMTLAELQGVVNDIAESLTVIDGMQGALDMEDDTPIPALADSQP